MESLGEFHEYLEQAFSLFRKDPPTTDYQKGYLGALLEMAGETSYEGEVEDLVKLT